MKKFSQIVQENLAYDNFGNAVVIEKPDIREWILWASGAPEDYFGGEAEVTSDNVATGVPEAQSDPVGYPDMDVPGQVHTMWHQAPKMTMMQAIEALEWLDDYYDLDLDDYDEDAEDWHEDDEDYDDIDLDTEMDESVELDERTILTTQMRRKRAWKKKKKKILGKRAQTKTFKRTHHFDNKKKKFVKRKKALKASDLKKKARIFKRVTRKGSTKAAAKRSRRRFSGKRLPRV